MGVVRNRQNDQIGKMMKNKKSPKKVEKMLDVS